ncbi:tRNA threonylcarbamoyl adenosine modification protein (Sua5/YciO/YrdC/YwlC family) [Terracoccus luteus]|uniref:L-threonylcarbamoyladenylate synthase n=1 Tax=Terracoccus luteus TaxID=53356 RepID=A0A495Y039_9MICO|nr:L-threonylcarbamoyladenylate synthase [Terracoccus luteus]RKT77348.1 tRNA threonylcarbamoyl adenosine modification protein (Sua5/YciO/YrdC/YwlC family) [Terracoccus luteus]
MSERYDCTDPANRTLGIDSAAAAVRRGEVVVLPTDTVYGIGCDAFDGNAVADVLAAKGRGRDMPPPVLIPTARTAQGLATQVPDYAQRLMERFWPGPLTLVLKSHTSLHWDLGETNGTVALRVPANEIALELLGEIGPMAVTSANTTGDPAARTVEDAVEMLGDAVSVYLDGGPASDGEASTIIDCTGEAPVTLRLGALAQEVIDAALEPDPDPDHDAQTDDETPDAQTDDEQTDDEQTDDEQTDADAVDETDAPSAAVPADAPEPVAEPATMGEWRDVSDVSEPTRRTDDPAPTP